MKPQKWEESKLIPFHKNFYVPHPSVINRSGFYIYEIRHYPFNIMVI